MKTLLAFLVVAGVAFIAGWRFAVIYKTPAVAMTGQAAFAKPKASPSPGSSATRVDVAAARPAAPGPGDLKIDEAGTALAAAIDLFTSPQSSFAQKQAIREQLRKEGRLVEVIATLKQLAAQNPNDPNIPTALGEAQLSQIRNLMEGGAGPASSDIAILGLQADQNFSAALALDPANWDAQFEKAAAMSYWPAAMNKGPEVVQRLSALVAQQEAAPPQPEFAQTYALLGAQYQAAGQTDKAMQIWQQGLGRFPLSPALQRAVARGSNP